MSETPIQEDGPQNENSIDDELVREDLRPTLPNRRRLPSFSSPNFSNFSNRSNFSMSRLRGAMNGKRIAALALLVVLVAGLIAIVVRNLPPTIHYAHVTTGSFSISFTTTGTLQSAVYGANFVEVGKLAEIDVKIGDTVTQGQTLAKLDSKLFDDAVNSAQAAVTAAQTQLSGAQTTQTSVQEQGNASVTAAFNKIAACKTQTCIQQAQDAYNTAQAAANAANAAAQQVVDNAQSAVNQAQASLQQTQDQQSAATLTASHSGTIAAINGAIGDTIGGANSTFIKIVDLGAIQVLSNVNVAQVGGITQDTVFRLVVPSVGKQPFGGTLEGVSPIGTQSHGVLMYPVLIDLDMQSTNGANLLPGMTATIRVITQQRTGVLLIPVSAVNFAQAAGSAKQGGFLSKSAVANALRQANQMLLDLQSAGSITQDDNPTPSYVLEYSNSNWVIKPVVLGLTDGQVYIVLAGLHSGDKIVTGEDGGSVTVLTPTPAVTH